MTEKQKRCWAALVVVLIAGMYSGYAISELDSFCPRELSTAAKRGFIVCWSAGLACALSSVFLGILAMTSMRHPGVPWWRLPNTLFDLSFVFPISDFYTHGGIRTLRKGRYCFTTWLVCWAIGMAVVDRLEFLVALGTFAACVAILAAAHGFNRRPPLVETVKTLDTVALLAEPPPDTVRGVRKRSTSEFAGLPLYDIAIGPDPEKGEIRGYARGIIAIGDIATGWLAVGGLARGLLAIGGGAIGVVAIGGGALGLIGVGGLAVGGLVFGGLAVGGIAVGGGAIGLVAIGGGAFGYYAYGAGALGKYTVSFLDVNSEAAKFFQEWFPWLPRMGR